MTQAIGNSRDYKVPSIWFYTENDSRFLPDLARMAHNEYLKMAATQSSLPVPSKRDGHYLFSDPAGIPLWREEVT